MKLLYISSIFKQNSFGEVSQKLLKMFFKYSDWDIYLYNIGCCEEYINKNCLISKCKNIFILPNYTFNNNREFNTLYVSGVLNLKQYILQTNPDIVMLLYNDLNILHHSKIIHSIRDVWKGKFIPYVPVDYANCTPQMLEFECDSCLTMNEWSVIEINKSTNNSYPVYNCPHIVDEFHCLNDIINLKNKFFGKNSTKYICRMCKCKLYSEKIRSSYTCIFIISF